MARSSYVYLALQQVPGEPDLPVQACTTKHEFVTWLDRQPPELHDGLALWRIQDYGGKLTRLTAKDLLG